jgi:glycosyltransferase involved in cell wall biosynthesis
MTAAAHSAAQAASALFLTNRLPWPLIDGWSRRTFHVVRQLAVEWPVRLIVFSDGDRMRLDAAQLALGSSVQIESVRRRPLRRLRGIWGSLFRDRPFHVAADSDDRFARAVSEALRSGDARIIGCAGVNMAGYFVLDASHRAMHLVDTHNIDSLVVDRFASLISDPFRRAFAALSGPQMRAWEAQVFTNADLVMVCSSSEVVLTRQIAPSASVQCVPNGADVLPAYPVATRNRSAPTQLFFGRLDYFPNIDAMQYLRSAMIEPLREQLPGFRVRIVGAGDGSSLTALFRDVPEVEVVGFVDSLDEELAKADAVIVPLRTGGGTRLKILEAMAAGRPVISTSVGAEGIEATDGVDILLRDEPGAFVKAIGAVLREPVYADRIGKAARQLIVDCYSWDGIGRALRKSVREELAKNGVADKEGLPSANGRGE